MTPLMVLLSCIYPVSDKVHSGQPETGETAETGDTGRDLDSDGDGLVDEGTNAYDDDGDEQAERDGDCDDSNADIYLGAEEFPGDGADQSCDGSDAGPVAPLAAAGAIWTAAEASLGAGWTVSFIHAPDDATTIDVLAGAPKRSDGGGNFAPSGFASLYRTSAFGGSLLDASAVVVGDGDRPEFGQYMASNTDVDSDGYDDVLVGVPFGAQDEDTTYKAFAYAGPLVGAMAVTDASWLLRVDYFWDGTGSGTALVSDAGDGLGRIALGSAWESEEMIGDISLYAGDSGGKGELDDALCRLTSEQVSDYAGYTLATIGDMDADGIPEVAVTALFSSVGAAQGGGVYVVPANLAETGSLADVDGAAFGVFPGEEAGIDVGPADDINGDGYADLVLGAHLSDESYAHGGRAYLILGPLLARGSLADAEAIITPETSAEYLGMNVSTAGDFDADGLPDLAIAAPRDLYAPRNYPGKVYLFLSPISGVVSGAAADLVMPGEAANDFAGVGLTGGEDLNADGYDDLVIGAPYNQDGGVAAGKVYAIYGTDL